MAFGLSFGAANLRKTLALMQAQRLAAEQTAFERAKDMDAMRRAQETLQLQGHRLDLDDRIRTDTLDSQTFDREAKRVESVDENAMAGDPVDDSLAGLMQKHGRGGSIRTTRTAQPVPQAEMTAPFEQSGALRTTGIADAQDERTHRGGSKYMAAQQLRGQQDEAARVRAGETAEAARVRAGEASAAAMERTQYQGGIQQQIAEGRNQTAAMVAGIANAGRAERDAEKRNDKIAKDNEKRQLVVAGVDDTLNRLKRLGIEDASGNFTLRPDIASLYGTGPIAAIRTNIPGRVSGSLANADADIKQATADAVIETIKDMKQQSQTGATGFGQLNLQELDILLSSASKLKARQIPPAAAQAELSDMIRKLTRIRTMLSAGGSSTSAVPAGSAAPRRRRYNPATGTLE